MIGAGGTGGHVYPALAAAEALVKHYSPVILTFAGSGTLAADMVRESGLPFADYRDIQGGPIAGVSLVQKLVSLFKLLVGTAQALAMIRHWRPDVVLLTGGWGGLPTAVAARLCGVPVLIYLPDIEPGSTIRVLQRFAARIAITVPDSSQYFPNVDTRVTGYPLREDFCEATCEAGQAHFGLDPTRKTLFVFGGSRGARSINLAVKAIVPDLVALGIQIIHVSGSLDWPNVEQFQQSLTGETAQHYHAFPYLHHEMGLGMAAADLVICRSGASTLAELPYYNVPSILVPYPYAWQYQKVNADYLAAQGAAICMEDGRLTSDLLPTVRHLMEHPAELAAMQTAAQAINPPNGSLRLAEELVQLAKESQ